MRGNFNLQVHYSTPVYNVQENIQFFLYFFIFLFIILFHIDKLGIKESGQITDPPAFKFASGKFFLRPVAHGSWLTALAPPIISQAALPVDLHLL